MPTLSELIPDDLSYRLDEATRLWHLGQPLPATGPAPAPPATGAALSLHRANYDLWHLEDDARDPGAPDARIAACKRAIDATNQRRNDLMEEADDLLLRAVEQSTAAPLHSETPGQMLDRISILSLKVHHTREEVERTSATAEHRSRNAERLQVLLEQRSDLVEALQLLSQEIAEGHRRFKLYRQMKMYNDPELNPVLYRQQASHPGAA